MSGIEDYRRARQLCQENAAKASAPRLRELWQAIADGYGFLLELDSQPPCQPRGARRST